MFEGLSTELVGAAIYDMGRSALNRLTQNEWVQRFLKKYDLKGAQHDFAARYLEALVELHLQQKPTEVLSFFRETSISSTFYHFYYGEETIRSNEAQVQHELAHWVAALKVGEELNNAHLDPLQEAQAFWQIFRQKVQESRTVKEVELEQQVRKLQSSVDQVNRQNSIPNSKFLTPLPFQAEIFLGREKDLHKIHDTLFNSNDKLLLLINGEGGIGKTSLASKYFDTYQDKYTYRAWVFKEKSIAESLMVLAIPLKVEFDEKWDIHQRLDVLIMAMASLPKPCLLVIDNANELQDLRQYLPHLQRCSNFHILFTTRISDFPQLASYKIEPLTQDQALQVFKAHYPAFEPQEEALFYEIYAAVQGNTLVLELLAKNLRNFNTKLKKNYLLADLRHDLEQGLLQLSKSSAVDIRYQAQGTGLRHEKIEVIIAAMYDLGELSAAEVQALSIFAVLPAESIPFERLKALNLGLQALDTTLLTLAQKGWLDYNEATASFKCSPVVQELVRLKNENLLEDCRALILSLCEQLDEEHRHLDNYSHSIWFVRYGGMVLNYISIADADLGLLWYNVGSFYTDIGEWMKALAAFQCMEQVFLYLLNEDPANTDLKNGLAMSYEKLGESYRELGELKEALTYFKKEVRLFELLNTILPEKLSFKNSLARSYQYLGDSYHRLEDFTLALDFFESSNKLAKYLLSIEPKNLEYKHVLAISYRHLGNTYRGLNNLQKALNSFEKEMKLFKELYEPLPQKAIFKNGLAISYQYLGHTYLLLENLKKSLDCFEQSNQLAKELSQDYPLNSEYKSVLAISFQHLGELFIKLNSLDRALNNIEQFNQLEKELHILSPHNVEFKNSLASSYQWLGWFLEEKMQNPAKAKEHYRASMVLLEELVASSPDYVQFKQSLDWVKAKLRE